MKFLTVIFFVSNALLLLNNCDSTDPKLELELKDVSCTEAWLQLTTNNIQLPTTINLYKNNSISKVFSLNTQDSLLYIDSLLPNQSYKFKVVLNTTNYPQPTTNEVLAQTMDTTSHNFTWQTFEFGQHSSSVLYDVAIIDENNIWAVGEIYMNDSLGNPESSLYNLIKWNGTQWKPERVYYNYQGSDFIAPIHSIFGFTINDIWVGSNQPMRWNGNIWQKWDLLGNVWNGWINKIWGSGSSDLYAVGNSGNLAQYNGSSWQKIVSGTTLSFQDIFGALSHTGEVQILAIASDKFSTGGKYLVRLNGNNAVHLTDIIDPAVSLSGVWFIPDKKYYLVGDGIYKKHFLSENNWQLDSIIYQIQYYPYSIRGNGINDVVVCGEAGTVSHFNGVSWQIFNGDYIYDRLLSLRIKHDIIIAVGTRYNNGINNQGIIYYGRR